MGVKLGKCFFLQLCLYGIELFRQTNDFDARDSVTCSLSPTINTANVIVFVKIVIVNGVFIDV